MDKEDLEKLENEISQLKSLGVPSDTVAKLETNLSQLKKHYKCANQEDKSNTFNAGCVIKGILVCALCWFIKSIVIPSLVTIQAQDSSFSESASQSGESTLLVQDIEEVAITNLLEWTTITQENRVEFKIPPTMEVRSLSLSQIANEYANAINIPQAANQIVIQQKGLNSAEESAGNHYVRLIYTCDVGKSGDFCSKAEILNGASWETKYLRKLQQIGNTLKTETMAAFRQSGATSKILSWNDMTFVKFGDYIAIKTSYLRQYDKNEPVLVEVYQVCDDSRLHTFLFSCRKSEASMWLYEWSCIKNTIRFDE